MTSCQVCYRAEKHFKIVCKESLKEKDLTVNLSSHISAKTHINTEILYSTNTLAKADPYSTCSEGRKLCVVI